MLLKTYLRWYPVVIGGLFAAALTWIVGATMLHINPPAPNMFAVIPFWFYPKMVFPALAGALVALFMYLFPAVFERERVWRVMGGFIFSAGMFIAGYAAHASWYQHYSWLFIGTLWVLAPVMLYLGMHVFVMAPLVGNHKIWR